MKSLASMKCIALLATGMAFAGCGVEPGDTAEPGAYDVVPVAAPAGPVQAAVAGSVGTTTFTFPWVFYTPDVMAASPTWIDATRNLINQVGPITAFASRGNDPRAAWALVDRSLYFNPRLDLPSSLWTVRFDAQGSPVLPAGGFKEIAAMQTDELRSDFLVLLVHRTVAIGDDQIYAVVTEDGGQSWRSGLVARSFSLVRNQVLEGNAIEVCAANRHIFASVNSFYVGGGVSSVGADLYVSTDVGRTFSRAHGLYESSGVEATPLGINCNVWTWEGDQSTSLRKSFNENFAVSVVSAPGFRVEPVRAFNRLKSFNRSPDRLVFAPAFLLKPGTPVPADPRNRLVLTRDGFATPPAFIKIGPAVRSFDLVQDGTDSRIVVTSAQRGAVSQLVYTTPDAGTTFVNRTGDLDVRICAQHQSCFAIDPSGIVARY